MDPDEFVARMVAAGVPDMELSAAPGSQSDATLTDQQGLSPQAVQGVTGSPRSSMAQAQPFVDPSSGHLVAPHSAPPGDLLLDMHSRPKQ